MPGKRKKTENVKKTEKRPKTQKRPNKQFGAYKRRLENDELENVTIPDLDNPFNFYNLLMSEHYVKWLRNNRLLASTLHCDNCEEECIINKRKGRPNGESFRCRKNKNCEYSIKKGHSLN